MQNVLQEALYKHFNYSDFRLGQQEIMMDVLEGKDVLGVLPTGSGKSICFQLPAMLMEGLTIVVSPLISLMVDQVKELKAKNFKQVAALNSFIDYRERLQILQHLHMYKLIYVSPELLQQEIVINSLKKQSIRLFVIDEAHCISQWGHDFRPDYLKLSQVMKVLQNPPTLALSATATPEIQKDIIHILNRQEMTRHIFPMDRKNITFMVEKVQSQQDKLIWMIDYLKSKSHPTLIYFSSKIQAERIAIALSRELSQHSVAFYHGGMDTHDRIAIQQQFMNNQLDIICCTSAFGMGINKPDIRTVIHYHFPTEIESYIQESGRAGRDGEPSLSITLYDKRDVFIPKNMIENELPTEDELNVILQQLLYFSVENKTLSSSSMENSELFQISETKWRFLRFHFEKHGMIYNNHISNFKAKFQLIHNDILQIIINRKILKEKKLEQMIQWLESESCLRKELYQDFQDSFEQPIFACCSNCGIDFSNWEDSQNKPRKFSLQQDWKSKLSMLLSGDVYEAK